MGDKSCNLISPAQYVRYLLVALIMLMFLFLIYSTPMSIKGLLPKKEPNLKGTELTALHPNLIP